MRYIINSRRLHNSISKNFDKATLDKVEQLIISLFGKSAVNRFPVDRNKTGYQDFILISDSTGDQVKVKVLFDEDSNILVKVDASINKLSSLTMAAFVDSLVKYAINVYNCNRNEAKNVVSKIIDFDKIERFNFMKGKYIDKLMDAFNGEGEIKFFINALEITKDTAKDTVDSLKRTCQRKIDEYFSRKSDMI